MADASPHFPGAPAWFDRALGVPFSSERVEVDGCDIQSGITQSRTIGLAFEMWSLTTLGVVPSQNVIVAERFFDEAGGMQLIIHSPFGARINRAWGLALRKRFCRTFNFELQAAATDNGLVLSLSVTLPACTFWSGPNVRPARLTVWVVAPVLDTAKCQDCAAPGSPTALSWFCDVISVLPVGAVVP